MTSSEKSTLRLSCPLIPLTYKWKIKHRNLDHSKFQFVQFETKIFSQRTCLSRFRCMAKTWAAYWKKWLVCIMHYENDFWNFEISFFAYVVFDFDELFLNSAEFLQKKHTNSPQQSENLTCRVSDAMKNQSINRSTYQIFSSETSKSIN